MAVQEIDVEVECSDRALLARAYTDDIRESHPLAIEVAGRQRMLCEDDLQDVLGRAAVRYFQECGRSEIDWLGARNRQSGYSKLA